MDTVQSHPLVQAMRLVRELHRRMIEQGTPDEQHAVIVGLVPKRKLLGLGGRYYVPIKKNMTVCLPSCDLVITGADRIARWQLEHFIDGNRCDDKKGNRISGWFIVDDIGTLTIGELEQINQQLLTALAPVA